MWVIQDEMPALSFPQLGQAAWGYLLLAGATVFRYRADPLRRDTSAAAGSRRREVSEERLRIARELHDVLAHNVSLINVQASTALHLIDAEPERTQTALAAIKEAKSRGQLLQELRATVEALRVDEDAPLADGRSGSGRRAGPADRRGGIARGRRPGGRAGAAATAGRPARRTASCRRR